MFFRKALVVAAALTTGAFAALPFAGYYRIVNPQTGNRFEVSDSGTAPRIPIVASPPIAADNQKWYLAYMAAEGEASAFYQFTAASPVRLAFVSAQHEGNGLTAERFGRPFNVTELSTGLFTLTIPLTNPLLAVTAHETGSQLTLEPRDATNELQVWTFQRA